MKFRKKPVVIEAAQWNGETVGDRTLFCSEYGLPLFALGCRGPICGLIIPTLEGDHIAIKGDWIIKGVAGEYYPCKPDIFEATYERVDE